MKNRTGLFLLTFLMAGGICIAQESGERRYGVVHNIAEDRQVEKVGGVYEPEGIDKYMKRHFEALRTELSAIKQSVEVMGNNIQELRDLILAENRDETLTA